VAASAEAQAAPAEEDNIHNREVLKMKKHSLIAFILACSIFAVWAFSMPEVAFAANYKIRIHDSYDCLTESDEVRINEVIKKAENKVNALFLVEIYNCGIASIPKEGESIVRSFGLRTENNIVVLEIYYMRNITAELFGEEPYTHHYKMYTYGYPHKQITDEEVNAILDNENVYNNIKSGNYADGIVAFIEETVKAMPEKRVEDAFKTNEDDTTDIFTPILLCVSGVLFYGGIFASSIIRKRRGLNNPNSTVSGGFGGGFGGSFGGSSGGCRGGR
jgi:hypothetical protein